MAASALLAIHLWSNGFCLAQKSLGHFGPVICYMVTTPNCSVNSLLYKVIRNGTMSQQIALHLQYHLSVGRYSCPVSFHSIGDIWMHRAMQP